MKSQTIFRCTTRWEEIYFRNNQTHTLITNYNQTNERIKCLYKYFSRQSKKSINNTRMETINMNYSPFYFLFLFCYCFSWKTLNYFYRSWTATSEFYSRYLTNMKDFITQMKLTKVKSKPLNDHRQTEAKQNIIWHFICLFD